MGHLPEYTTKRGYLPGYPALTGGCGFDQCPAPFAGPLNLADRPSDPRYPLLTPMLGSVS